MSDYKFTPGPWKIQIRTTPGQFVRETHIVSADESHIAEVTPCAIEANAKLISAAPDLLNACIESLAALKTGYIQEREKATELIYQAIKKATEI